MSKKVTFDAVRSMKGHMWGNRTQERASGTGQPLLAFTSLLALLALGACRAGSARENAEASPPVTVASGLEDARAGVTSEVPHRHETAEAMGEHFDVDLFTFDLASHRLELVDLHATRDLAGAFASKSDAVFATNAGFFDEHDQPLGLSISRGVRASIYSPTLSGGVLEVGHGRAELFETESYDKSRSPEFAVQCRPRLVVHGRANVRRDDGKRAERTAACLTKNGRELTFVIAKDAQRGPSLFALGHWLEQRGCDDALSLDGGPSTGAVYASPSGTREIALRGPIRQAIVVSRGRTP